MLQGHQLHPSGYHESTTTSLRSRSTSVSSHEEKDRVPGGHIQVSRASFQLATRTPNDRSSIEESPRQARAPARSSWSTRFSDCPLTQRRRPNSPTRSSPSTHSLIPSGTRRRSLTPMPPGIVATLNSISMTVAVYKRPRCSRSVLTSPDSHASPSKNARTKLNFYQFLAGCVGPRAACIVRMLPAAFRTVQR